ncbi:MAG TPA: alkaline phosphatase family protein [Acidimicrobiales bacterium]|nr:alkaline phosphatase family protein [Acidimicrobiales bacterium]
MRQRMQGWRKRQGWWQRGSRLPFVLVVTLVAGGISALINTGAGTVASGASAPAIRHVFVIMLENESSKSTFGNPAADPYLAKTLPSLGAFLPNYYGVGHVSNDNYAAFVSGQPPNLLNQTDCIKYSNFINLFTLNGVDEGLGCVFPAATQTIGNQLTAAGLSWKGYMQDMGNIPGREAAACGHPALGATDGTQTAVPGDGYATRHDPFPYFHSIIDNVAYCDAHVVALGNPDGSMPAAALPGETGLATDLGSIATTPNFSFISPNLCMDGHDFPCKNQPSGASALADIDQFLQTWVPKIRASPAFQTDGLLLITFDEGSETDGASCCGETPNLTSPLSGLSGLGGGKVGAVLLSPDIKPGTVTTAAYNHFSALATFETLFGLGRLGEARTVTSTFSRDVFTGP